MANEQHWTDRQPHTWDDRRYGAHLSDAEVASKVRMLMRHDLDHEQVCCLARDRIAYLSRRCRDLENAARYALPIIEKYAHTQGDNAEFHAEIAAPIRLALNPLKDQQHA